MSASRDARGPLSQVPNVGWRRVSRLSCWRPKQRSYVVRLLGRHHRDGAGHRERGHVRVRAEPPRDPDRRNLRLDTVLRRVPQGQKSRRLPLAVRFWRGSVRSGVLRGKVQGREQPGRQAAARVTVADAGANNDAVTLDVSGANASTEPQPHSLRGQQSRLRRPLHLRDDRARRKSPQEHFRGGYRKLRQPRRRRLVQRVCGSLVRMLDVGSVPRTDGRAYG